MFDKIFCISSTKILRLALVALLACLVVRSFAYRAHRVHKMSCCPPNAEKYLAATGSTAGQCVSHSSGQELYTTGSAAENKKAIIIIPDIWGWNSGRTRHIADMFAEGGYLTVVPKLLTPPLKGGTDGDGLYPEFTFAENGAEFGPYIGGFDWKGNLDRRIEHTVAYLHEQGAEKIAIIGFCWGGWVLAHALAGDFGNNFVGGVIMHPSVHLEKMIFQRDVQQVFEAATKPMQLLNAKGDPEEYHVGGAWFEAHKAKHPSAESANYLNVNHGFVPRGDPNDPETQEATTDALKQAFRFIAAHMQ